MHNVRHAKCLTEPVPKEVAQCRKKRKDSLHPFGNGLSEIIAPYSIGSPSCLIKCASSEYRVFYSPDECYRHGNLPGKKGYNG